MRMRRVTAAERGGGDQRVVAPRVEGHDDAGEPGDLGRPRLVGTSVGRDVGRPAQVGDDPAHGCRGPAHGGLGRQSEVEVGSHRRITAANVT